MRPKSYVIWGTLLEKEYKITDTKLGMKEIILNKKSQQYCYKHRNFEKFYFTHPYQITVKYSIYYIPIGETCHFE